MWFHDIKYQAASWKKKRRVVENVEWNQGDLFPRVGFIVTNLSARADNAVKFLTGVAVQSDRKKKVKTGLQSNGIRTVLCYKVDMGNIV